MVQKSSNGGMPPPGLSFSRRVIAVQASTRRMQSGCTAKGFCGSCHYLSGGTAGKGQEFLHGPGVDEGVFGSRADRNGGVGPEKGVGGLKYLVAQEDGVVRIVLEEFLNFLPCLRTAVAAEQGSCPVAREENVAGALDFLEDVEAGTDVSDGGGLAQGVVEVAEYGGCPGLYASVFGLHEALEEGVAGSFVRIYRSGDVVEAAEPVGVGQAGPLRGEYVSGPVREGESCGWAARDGYGPESTAAALRLRGLSR